MSAIIIDNILGCHCESIPDKIGDLGTWQSLQALCHEVVK